MMKRKTTIAAAAVAVLTGLAVAQASTPVTHARSTRAIAAPSIAKFTSTRIRTLTMDTQVVSLNRAELDKIPGDFKEAYRFRHVFLSYVQPDKLQFSSVVLGTQITYTINGNRKFTSIPSYHVHKVEDTTGSPGKKQSLLDVGLVPPELLKLYNGTFLRKEGNLFVYQIMPKQRGETYKDIVWIDPVTHITVKRMHYSRDGKLTAWYQYLNPVSPRPHMFVPSRVEVYNPENRLAAVTSYTNIKINLPVDSSIFDF